MVLLNSSLFLSPVNSPSASYCTPVSLRSQRRICTADSGRSFSRMTVEHLCRAKCMFGFSVCSLKAFLIWFVNWQLCLVLCSPVELCSFVSFLLFLSLPLHPMVAVRMKKCHTDQFLISASCLPQVWTSSQPERAHSRSSHSALRFSEFAFGFEWVFL